MLSKFDANRMSAELPMLTSIFVTVYLAMLVSIIIASVYRVVLQLEVVAIEGDGNVGQLGVFMRTLHGYMVHSPLVLNALPLVPMVFV